MPQWILYPIIDGVYTQHEKRLCSKRVPIASKVDSKFHLFEDGKISSAAKVSREEWFQLYLRVFVAKPKSSICVTGCIRTTY